MRIAALLALACLGAALAPKVSAGRTLSGTASHGHHDHHGHYAHYGPTHQQQLALLPTTAALAAALTASQLEADPNAVGAAVTPLTSEALAALAAQAVGAADLPHLQQALAALTAKKESPEGKGAPVPAPGQHAGAFGKKQSGYCIPRSLKFSVLAVGDSITQGSVPSKNLNHPYTLRLRELLKQTMGPLVRAQDAGLGGGGIFMTGFSDPVTFGPYLDRYLAQGPWSVVSLMIGINDLLRGGRSAADIWAGLEPMVNKVLKAGTPVTLIPPFAAPGFVQQSDSKEAERKKLAGLMTAAAAAHTAASGGVGPQLWVLDMQSGMFDFYAMPEAERKKWLDDGLHMTEAAYDAVGEAVYKEIASHLCPA